MAATTNNHPRNMLVMKASAGSGKTYNLALQYIKHLLFTTDETGRLIPRRGSGDDRILNAHRLLLAITFTNKATDQMKGRIVDELYNLASVGKKSKYLQGFMNESGLPESRVRELARMALNELMLDYSNFNVSTIDSFFQSILRNFARELDRDFNYDIQLEAKYAIRVAIHNFMLSLGQEDKPTDVDKWVHDYQQHQLRGDAETKSWRFFEDGGTFLKFAKEIDSELFRSRMNKVRDYLGHVDENGDFKSDFRKIREFNKFLTTVINDCNHEKEPLRDDIVACLRPLPSDALFGGRIFDSIMNKGADPDTKLPGLASDKVANQFKPKNMPDASVIDRLTQLVDKYQRYHQSVLLMEYVKDRLGLLGMLGMIDVYLERFRHETNSILIGDTNELIGTVLESGSAFVYERVGTLISHFMIDEFQDTSTKQYENFHGLLKESLANGNFNMLIGDAKQSIYRFRNADPTVFREKVNRDFVNDIYEPPVKPGAPSSVNYRSSRRIIEFNNALFAFVAEQYSDNQPVATTFGDATQGMPPTIDEDKVPGFVRIVTDNYQLVVNPGQPVKKPSTGKKDKKEEKKEEKKVTVLDVLPQYLLQLHERFDWGRIGILVNTRKEGNKIVECILDHNRKSPDKHISIISGESLLLSNSPIVRRIISMLRFIDISQYGVVDDDDTEPDEEPNTPNAQRMAKKRISDQRMYSALNEFIKRMGTEGDASAEDNGALLEQCLDATSTPDEAAPDAQSQDDRFMQLLESLLPNGNELTTLVNIVESVIAYFRSSDVMCKEVDREAAFLLAFQDTVMKFASMRNGGSLREFLKFWDEKKDALAVNTRASSNAINIMTIHKAKGLEFECVVIPFAAWQINDNSRETHYWMPGEAFVGTLQDGQTCDPAIVPPLINVNKKVLATMRDSNMLKDKALHFVDDQRTAVLIDNLNKTYVAMTRPCTELHLFTQGNTKTNDMDQLLKGFAEADGSIMRALKDVQDQDTGWFEYGELSSRELIDSKREQEVVTALQVPLTQYRVSAIPEDLKVRVDRSSSASIDAGLRLHSVMSQIQDVNDVDRVINQGIKHGVITNNPEDPCSIDNVEKHVCAPIKDPASRVAAWFDPANKVYSERTITAASDSIWDDGGIQNLRPDRIILRPDGTMLVIDYKSGQRGDKRYLHKLNQYMEKLRAIFPGVPIYGRLWYVLEDTIIDEGGKPLK